MTLRLTQRSLIIARRLACPATRGNTCGHSFRDRRFRTGVGNAARKSGTRRKALSAQRKRQKKSRRCRRLKGDNREASNRVDRSHSTSRSWTSSNERESLTVVKPTRQLRIFFAQRGSNQLDAGLAAGRSPLEERGRPRACRLRAWLSIVASSRAISPCSKRDPLASSLLDRQAA